MCEYQLLDDLITALFVEQPGYTLYRGSIKYGHGYVGMLQMDPLGTNTGLPCTASSSVLYSDGCHSSVIYRRAAIVQ